MLELAEILRYGRGVEAGPSVSRGYLECAVELGDSDAMLELARMHLSGAGGEVDMEAARELL